MSGKVGAGTRTDDTETRGFRSWSRGRSIAVNCGRGVCLLEFFVWIGQEESTLVNRGGTGRGRGS